MSNKKNENGQLKKAFTDGKVEGFRLVTTMIFWLLMEKHEWTKEDLKSLHKEIMYEFECLGGGYNTWEDIIKTVKEECDISVVLK